MNNDGVADARALVAKALAIGIDRITLETKLYGDPAWDSLGQLSVILAVEEELRRQIMDESTFEALTSVIGIAAYLTSAHIAQPSNP